ncbi:GGDEF domain-containing protein [Methylovorus glucosotrophus]|uniref:GGDEF domain-containing protein n=1 Tax=Methylovorus glucosotrophus TaxID=266009 RepID=UPI001FD554E4|nr:GGDEF domain-containing protein [Methylovorus glucosotrophus]
MVSTLDPNDIPHAGKSSLMKSFITFGISSLLILISLAAFLITVEWQEFRRASAAHQSTVKLKLLLLYAEKLSRERGPTNAILGNADADDSQLRQPLKLARQETDDAYARLCASIGCNKTPNKLISELGMLAQELEQERKTIDRLASLPLKERGNEQVSAQIERMVGFINTIRPLITTLSNDVIISSSDISLLITEARLAATLREYAGQLGSALTLSLSFKRERTLKEQLKLERLKGHIEELHMRLSAHLAVAALPAEIADAKAKMEEEYFVEATAYLDSIEASTNLQTLPSPDTFYKTYVPLMDSILTLRDALLAEAEASTIKAKQDALLALSVVSILMLVFLALTIKKLRIIHQQVVVPMMQASHALRSISAGHYQEISHSNNLPEEIDEVMEGINTLNRQIKARIGLEQERDELVKTLTLQSSTDFLTGLKNRRGFYEAANIEYSRAQRHASESCIMLIDIDHFKTVNDTYGHSAGDWALTFIGGILKDNSRIHDISARHGGEEFICMLGNSNLEEGCLFAEKIRTLIQAAMVDIGPDLTPIKLTVSIGITSSQFQHPPLDMMIEQADRALYMAKNLGRNRVQRFDDSALAATAQYPLL